MSKREIRHPSNSVNEVRTENRFERRGSNSELIKKTEDIKRDAMGRFEQGGRGGPRAGAGRPRGSKNKTTLALKEAILGALEEALEAAPLRIRAERLRSDEGSHVPA